MRSGVQAVIRLCSERRDGLQSSGPGLSGQRCRNIGAVRRLHGLQRDYPAHGMSEWYSDSPAIVRVPSRPYSASPKAEPSCETRPSDSTDGRAPPAQSSLCRSECESVASNSDACFDVGRQRRNRKTNQAGSRSCVPKISVLLPFAILALSGCASKPEIAVNSYCEIKATELIDMRDPGLRRLTPVNQGAVLTGDDNHARFCRGAVNKGR